VGIATIGSATGLVTGVFGGSVTMSYNLPTGCYRTYAFTVYPNPAPITGPGKVLSGTTITLADIITGGNWTSSNPALASIGISTGIVTPISSGSGVAMISYTIPFTGCLASRNISINPLPDSDLVTWYPFCNDIADHSGLGHDLIPTPTYAFPTS